MLVAANMRAGGVASMGVMATRLDSTALVLRLQLAVLQRVHLTEQVLAGLRGFLLIWHDWAGVVGGGQRQAEWSRRR